MRGGGRVGMLWWIWRSAFQTFRQLLWRVSFGSLMFCVQRVRDLFCGDVGFLMCWGGGSVSMGYPLFFGSMGEKKGGVGMG